MASSSKAIPGEALFSWRAEDGSSRTIHAPQQRQLMERYLKEHLLPLSVPFCPPWAGVEWWWNVNKDVDWHIDTDEVEGLRSGTYVLPLLSTVYYPMSAAPVASCFWRTTQPSSQALPVRCLSSAR